MRPYEFSERADVIILVSLQHAKSERRRRRAGCANAGEAKTVWPLHKVIRALLLLATFHGKKPSDRSIN